MDIIKIDINMMKTIVKQSIKYITQKCHIISY